MENDRERDMEREDEKILKRNKEKHIQIESEWSELFCVFYFFVAILLCLSGW